MVLREIFIVFIPQAVESEIKGPKVLYETSHLAAQALEPYVKSELTPDIQSDVKLEDYSSLNHLLESFT